MDATLRLMKGNKDKPREEQTQNSEFTEEIELGEEERKNINLDEIAESARAMQALIDNDTTPVATKAPLLPSTNDPTSSQTVDDDDAGSVSDDSDDSGQPGSIHEDSGDDEYEDRAEEYMREIVSVASDIEAQNQHITDMKVSIRRVETRLDSVVTLDRSVRDLSETVSKLTKMMHALEGSQDKLYKSFISYQTKTASKIQDVERKAYYKMLKEQPDVDEAIIPPENIDAERSTDGLETATNVPAANKGPLVVDFAMFG